VQFCNPISRSPCLSVGWFSDTISMSSHENLRTLSRLEFSTSHKTARTIRGIFGEKFAVVICVETLEAFMSMVVNVPIVVSSSKLGRKEKMGQLNAISFLLQFFFQSDCRSLKARILSLAQDRPYNSWHLWREDCSCDLRWDVGGIDVHDSRCSDRCFVQQDRKKRANGSTECHIIPTSVSLSIWSPTRRLASRIWSQFYLGTIWCVLERIIVEQFPRLFWGLPISIEAPMVVESQIQSLFPDYCIALLRIFKKTGVICCQSFPSSNSLLLYSPLNWCDELLCVQCAEICKSFEAQPCLLSCEASMKISPLLSFPIA
jgi:hypothetical protein